MNIYRLTLVLWFVQIQPKMLCTNYFVLLPLIIPLMRPFEFSWNLHMRFTHIEPSFAKMGKGIFSTETVSFLAHLKTKMVLVTGTTLKQTTNLDRSQEQVLKQKQIWTGHRNNFKTENKFGPVTGTTLITSDKFEPVTRTNF